MAAILRTDYQELARIRLKEARLLLKAKLYGGAYHTVGFVVECAMKACIAKTVARHQFPDKQFAQNAWTHSAQDLLKVSGLKLAFDRDATGNPALATNWAIVTKWNPEIRYSLSVTRTDALGLYSAITARRHGVLQWIRGHW
jgi:hypothetical protein